MKDNENDALSNGSTGSKSPPTDYNFEKDLKSLSGSDKDFGGDSAHLKLLRSISSAD